MPVDIQRQLAKFKAKYPENESGRAFILLILQTALIILLIATVVLVMIVDSGERFFLYLAIVVSLLVVLLLAFVWNLQGKYKKSALLTVICTVIGPWLSILMDYSVLHGDFMPLVYISLSIQLCSILLTEKTTILIAAVQLSSLVVLIILNAYLRQINWPSLVAYVFFTATLGIVASFMNRKQYEQIETHRRHLQQNEVRLQALAHRDSLTGLYNRRFMEEILEEQIGLAAQKNQTIGIIMADVDNFKTMNDTYGHDFGDTVLCQIADVFTGNTRSSDIVCRLGGDEFVIILPNTSLEISRRRAEQLGKLADGLSFQNEGIEISNISLSFGVAVYPEHGNRQKEILKAVDIALYASKKEGRIVSVYEH